MRILVTGATGFIGSHLVGRLIDQGHDVYILHRNSSDLSKVDSCVKRVCFDGDIESLTLTMREENIGGIIHLASLFVSAHKPEQIKPMIESNILLGVSLLEAAVASEVRWFVNTGSIWQNYCAPDRSDEYNPVNLYAATKQAFQTMARYYIDISDLIFVTLKLSDTYGPGDTRRKIISLFEENVKTGEELGMSPGAQRMSLVHIDDVTEGYLCILDMIADGMVKSGEEYTLNSLEFPTLQELAVQFEKAVGKPLNIKWGGRPYREREVMRPYRGIAPRGWKPNMSLKDVYSK